MMLLAIAAVGVLAFALDGLVAAGDADGPPAQTEQQLLAPHSAHSIPLPLFPFVHEVQASPVEGGWHVTWEAQLTGDYNQDGSVSILDLTPLAAHLNEAVGDDPWLVVIDGNDDGVVNILDFTPLAGSFGLALNGFEIQLSEDYDEFPFATIATVDFSEHKLPVEGRLKYETVITTEMTTGYLRVASIVYPEEPEWLWDPPVPLPGTG